MRRSPVILRLACLFALFPAFATPRLCTAQQQPTYILKVKETLIEIPVLVVTPSGGRAPQPNPADFTLSLDGGPPVPPSHVRLQGDDPLVLAILLDAHGGVDGLMPQLATALAALVPGTLHPQDSVVIYTLGCQLTRFSLPLPAVPSRISDQTRRALTQMTGEKHQHCGSARLLVTSFALIVKDLSQTPGRRIVLTFTSGYPEFTSDNSSRWTDLQHFANAQSTSIFAVTDHSVFNGPHAAENHLGAACQNSGGLVLQASPSALPATLVDFLAMLRGRSILDFRRPGKLPRRDVELEVKLKHSENIVLAAGNSIKFPDPADDTDPNLYHPDPTLAPEVGTRHSLKP